MKDPFVLAFSAFSGIGTIRLEKLIATFGSAENAWKGEDAKIMAALGKSIGEKFLAFRKNFDPQKYAKEIDQQHIDWLVPTDTQYPILLKKLEHPPFILFAKGNLHLLTSTRTIAVVGTRKVTPYGQQVTEMLTKELVQNDFVIVSGMALGVDGIAHATALESNGKTIAVLGSGVDFPTPREHTHLYNKILERGGLIISTFSPGEVPSVGSFPARNAVIAGISLGVVVTEGAKDSGSLITANYAKKLARPVLAVPGQITSHQSIGTNNLIKNGAVAISSAQDILDSLDIMKTQKVPVSHTDSAKVHGATLEEKNILSLLRNGPLHFDEIARTIGKDSKEIGSLLSMMELKGMVKNLSDGKYSLN